MKPAIVAALADELGRFLVEKLSAIDKRLDALGLPEKGDPGQQGVGIAAIEQDEGAASFVLVLDDGARHEVLLPAGVPGDKGDEGEPGPAPDVDDLAPVLAAELMALPDFVATLQAGAAPAAAWQPGVYRKGAALQHHMGRTYVAQRDTVQEPGEGDDWQRIGTAGMRHRGGFKDGATYEAGDIYTKDGSTFLHDGARAWLMAARPFTEDDANKQTKGLRLELAQNKRECAELRRMVGELRDTLAEMRGALEGMQ